MKRVDLLWAAGLLLKGIGATWDVSWHFRILREAISPPHMINVVGGILCAYALWIEWRSRTARTTGPLLIVLAGIATFLLAIPFDQFWHTRFGIDLTTWSPAHLMLFYGTALSCFGVLMLYRAKGVGPRLRDRAMLAFFLVFFAAALYFPLTYNEYTTVAAQTILTAPETMDPDLVAFARTVDDPIFHGTPRALYAVYSVGIAVFVGTMARLWIGRGWALVALAAVSAERVLADAILGAAGWPHAALPLQFALMGIALELAWLLAMPPPARAITGALAASLAGYAWFAATATGALAVGPLVGGTFVPVGADSWALGLGVAVVAALLAMLLVRRGLRYVETVPEMRSIRDVQAWLTASR